MSTLKQQLILEFLEEKYKKLKPPVEPGKERERDKVTDVIKNRLIQL